MAPRTGRPSADPRRNQYRIRLTDEEVQKLAFCSMLSDKTKAEIIREGIDKFYQDLIAPVKQE